MKRLNLRGRSWVEISLRQLKNNIELLKCTLGKTQEIMAVVKADAYGHGDVEVSRTLQKCGINNLAVSNIDEAVRLRGNGIEGQILILGYTPIEQVQKLVTYDITQAVLSEDYAELLYKVA